MALWTTGDTITAAKLNKSFNTGLDASKGTPGVVGEGYYATDTNILYYSSNGSTWDKTIPLSGTIANADVAAGAAIAMSKLSLAITNSEVAAGAAIAKSKLANLDVVNADVNASAAIAMSKLSLAITNSEVAAGAAIDTSKLADGSLFAKAAKNSFSPNDTNNRAVAHGLGAAPKIIIWGRTSGSNYFWGIIMSGYEWTARNGTSPYSVTVPDVTNFYCSNGSYASNYSSGDTTYWVAIL